jgi:asparagine synthetase B (glutamine-hydrolysing)
MGYGWYWKYWNTKKVIQLKNILFSNQFKEHIKNVQVFSKQERRNLWINRAFINEDIYPVGTKTINIFDLSVYLPGQLLTKIDRAGMMHSLEVRSPFLDYRLAEYVFSLPEEYKTDRKNGKIILKDILAEIMPKEFVYRRKLGFGAPIKKWLREDAMKKYVVDTIYSSLSLKSLFRIAEIENIFDKFYLIGDDEYCYKIWTLLCLALWFKSHHKYHEQNI